MPEDQWMPLVKDRTIDAMMAMIREDLDALNVHPRRVLLERTLHACGAAAIRTSDLTFKGHVYKGTLPPPGASCRKIGKTANERCSARPRSATTWTVR